MPARAAMSGLSDSIRTRRRKLSQREAYDAGDFFEGQKTADDDRRRRHGS